MGPMQLEARFNQHDVISKDLSLWNQQGSGVIQVNMMVLPLKNYEIHLVKPIFLQATGGKMPELKRVVVASGERLAYADTYENALRGLAGLPLMTASNQTENPGSVSVNAPADFTSAASQCSQEYLKLTSEGMTSEAGRALEKLGAILGEGNKNDRK